MESNHVEMHRISKEDQPDKTKDNVVLRALVGDPNRHKALVQHTPPTRNVSQEREPASMYTLETRYGPIPSKVLPQPSETKVYYIENNTSEQPSPLITKEERDTSFPVEPEGLKNIKEETLTSPIIFLEPKIISQPILYSIVAAKTLPVQSDQPVPTNKETHSPLLYSITGDPHPPNIVTSANNLNVAAPVVDDKSPTLYSLIGGPRLRVQIQEPIQQTSQLPQQSSPSLYSTVGSPHLPTQIQVPVRQTAVDSPILYSTVGNPHLPAQIQVPVKQPTADSQQLSPSLYSTVGSPHLPTQIQVPVKQSTAASQQLSPSLYSTVGSPHLPTQIQLPVKQPTVASPSLYSIVGSPRLKVQIEEPVKQASQPSQRFPPTLYSTVGSPNVPSQIQEPVKQPYVLSQQSSPSLYLIVGRPRLQVKIQEPIKQTSPGLYSTVGNPVHTEANVLSPIPLTQPNKISSIQPAPILYTIVGEAQVPVNIPKENRPPLVPIKKRANDIKMFTVTDEPSIPQPMTFPRKVKLSQPLQQQTPAPSLYSLTGKPTSSPEENTDIRLKPLVRRKLPTTPTAPTRRISRSLERQTAPEPFQSTKHKRQARSREPTIPKSETVFIPLRDEDRPPRPKKQRTGPRGPSYEDIHHKLYNIPQYDPLHLGDYVSPYAYRPSKPYRERNYNTHTLPPLTNNRSGHKSRSPFYEPHNREKRLRPYAPSTHRSLERYSVNTGQRSRLWDYEYQTQTDDDDDDAYESNSDRKHPHYRRRRPRTPWIPVW